MRVGKTLIRGGVAVTASDQFLADVLVEDGRITCLAEAGRLSARGVQVLDASGCYVTPGGIDVHTHLNHRVSPETTTADDFLSGSRAAAAGGTTTIIDFAPAHERSSLLEALHERLADAQRDCVVDFSFHAAITAAGLTHGPDDMRAVLSAGVSTFKVYMAYPNRMMSDDSTLLEVLSTAADLRCLVLVHAENGHMVQHITQKLIAKGKTAEHMHVQAHPEAAEAEAVNRIIELAGLVDCDVYIVHVSSSRAAAVLGAAKQRGARVWGETCPQYLCAAYEDYRHLGFEAVKYVCSPPIRELRNQELLWKAIENGSLSTIATDHAPFLLREEESGRTPTQKGRGKGYFPQIPNGVPGIEERLKLLLQFGVSTGRITLPKFVDLTASRPAQLMGLNRTKGTLAVGADADVVVWDPDASHQLRAVDLSSNVDYSLYEGIAVSWKPRFVLSRGDVIVEDNEIRAAPGRGRFLRRSPIGVPLAQTTQSSVRKTSHVSGNTAGVGIHASWHASAASSGDASQ
ncbi:MAG TPA: dihydropyrimidinase, partial [Rhodothermia bacterium]|nr:dihydropyrimidinase [Rhodothermia bacterium]